MSGKSTRAVLAVVSRVPAGRKSVSVRAAWVAVTVAAVVGITAGCTGGSGGHGAPAGPGSAAPAGPAAPTAWQQVLGRIGPDGRVSTETALQAFALAVGPVPGVSGPAGAAGEIRSGTLAVEWVVGHWRELSAAQRQAVRAAISGDAQPHRFAAPRAAPAAPAAPAVPACLPRDAGDAGKVAQLRAALEPARSELAGRLPSAVLGGVTVTVAVNQTAAEGDSEMYTSMCRGGAVAMTGDQVDGCTIHANPVAFTQLTAAERSTALLHELTHCAVQSRGGAQNYPAWFAEGFATWATVSLRPGDRVDAGWWRRYLDTPAAPLFGRSYDAVGFFVHLAETGVDPWQRVLDMRAAMASAAPQPRTAPGGTPVDPTTLDTLRAARMNEAGWKAAGVGAAFLDSWGSGFVRGRYPGRPWTTGAAGLPAYRGAIPARTLGTAGAVQVAAAPAGSAVATVSTAADIITVAVSAGAQGRLSIGGGRDLALAAAAGSPLCNRRGGCGCPGDPATAPALPAISGNPFYLGVTGGLAAGSVTLTGATLASYCAKPRASCLVGDWTSTNVHATVRSSALVQDGGAGARMTITRDGRGTVTFDGMRPINATVSSSDQQLTIRFSYRGSATGTIVLPAPGATSGRWLVKDASTSHVAAAVQVVSPFAADLGVIDLSALAGQLGGGGTSTPLSSGGLWRCSGRTLNLDLPPELGTGGWTFTRR
jgi:hypothetical protein